MPLHADEPVQRKFASALDALVEQVKRDRSILAALLCGSLSHDIVWANSDIDLVLVTVNDQNVEQSDLSLNADGIKVHAMLVPRRTFRQTVEGSTRNSILHSFLTKGRLLYTHDETIARLCAALTEIGRRDTSLQLLRAATAAAPTLYKARKWLLTRNDLEYTAVWILAAATPLAEIEVMSAGLLPDREVLPQALRLNPGFFQTVYVDLLNQTKTTEGVEASLNAAESYLAERAEALFKPVLDHLRDVGEARSARELEDHFARNFGVAGVTTACEYLAHQGLIGKASTEARLTKKSNVEIQELAFFYIGPRPAVSGAPTAV